MIHIVTVYNSLNPGSFLQATSLYAAIAQRYPDVAFLDVHARNLYLSGIKCFVKLLCRGQFRYGFQQQRMPWQYAAHLSQYNTAKNPAKDGIFILGSDEIWNISRKAMASYPVFWGAGLNQTRCISYGPSVNDATASDLESYPYARAALKNLSAVSVRDGHSQTVLKHITDREIAVVCDPVLLHPAAFYRANYSKKQYDRPYILVYGPERHFAKEAVRKIREFARQNNLLLYSYFSYHDWVDKTFFGDAYCFLELIDSASYVFTSTFHGTTFSILYNKQFAVFGENKKVQETLSCFGLGSQQYIQGPIEAVLFAEYRYDQVNQMIRKQAADSRAWLFGALDTLLNDTHSPAEG